MKERIRNRSILDSATPSSAWTSLAEDYETKVFSVTSFPRHRQKLLQHILPGLVVDLGCGPLGLLLGELAHRPNIKVVGIDFCESMVRQSRRHTESMAVEYLLADNRALPIDDASIDTVMTVNSFLPETRPDVELMFSEATRVLRAGGRLVAVLPAFEMSLIARDRWGMRIRLDIEGRREQEATGWQCFYTHNDIVELLDRHELRTRRMEHIVFRAPDEVKHVRTVYAAALDGVPTDRLLRDPLFEHFVVAERI